MTVTGADSEITLRDVLVGEVWLCSGQSNMQWSVSQSSNADAAIPAADHPAIRLFTVPARPAGAPRSDLLATSWQTCRPDTVAAFSAVAYFFGRELHRHLDVPVGLINASWGGTRIEAWMSEAALETDASGRRVLDDYRTGLADLSGRQAEFDRQTRETEERTRDTVNRGVVRGWADPSEPSGEWGDMELPTTWQARGLEFSGVLWFRRDVELPAEWVGRDLSLSIGATDKSDTTYFNGVQVGRVTMQDRPDAWSLQRVYPVPAGLARGGHNTIAVRVHSNMFAGGMTGPAPAMRLSCPSLPEAAAIPLAGRWRYAVESNYGFVEPPVPPMGPDNPNAPGALYNGMIEPVAPYPLRGALWYQGESNAAEPAAYRTLLPGLIRCWRRRWQQEHLHFLTVQLPNYGYASANPSRSHWAELREAQAQTLALPDTGLAVTIDLGLSADIHPPNKLDVGRRLAWNACDTIYKRQTGLGWAPTIESWRRDGRAILATFTHTGGGLVCRGNAVEGFSVAGADRRFVPANAAIEPDGATVRVQTSAVADPAATRYLWANDPRCTLFGSNGLPAAPFRTDDWPALAPAKEC